MDKFEKTMFVITLLLLGIGFIMIGNNFRKIESKINQLEFIQEYNNYVVEDSLKQ